MRNGGKNKTTTEKRIRNLSILLSVVSVFFVFLTLATATHAVSFEDVSQTLGLGTSDLKETVINILNWALGLLGLIAVIVMLYGGWMWLSSAGNEEKIRRAKKILINASIGLVIILLSWAIVAFVLDFAENVTGPGGGQCVEGTEQGCWDCISGEWVYDPTNPSCPVPPEDTFEVRNIVTSCEDPGYYRENVFLCSGVTIVFNKVVKTDNLQSLIETNDPVSLKVEQCGPGSDFSTCNGPSQPIPLFNDPPPRIAYSESTPTGTKAEFVANGKAISFLHAHELFPQNTYFRLTIPKSIQDTTGRNLSVCQFQNGTDYLPCVDAGPTFEWIFFVGDENDTQAPTLVDSYPRFDPSDRDRNVPRTPIIWTRFSEAIAPWTITEDNIRIYGFDAGDQPDDEGNGGTRLGAPIDGVPPDPDNYDVFINPGGNGFELSFINGFQLDAFRWYEIEVNNLTDLCSNIQTPAPLLWRFETNGLGAGIATVYPPDGFQYSCPDTEVYVRFNTSMYDPATSGCTVNPPLGFVTGGTNIPPRNPLEVEDDYPGSGDPNAYCKKYSYRPTTEGLALNTDFDVTVNTRYELNQDGDTLAAHWAFGTAPTIDECANPPVIDFLSPDHGPAGTCLSVRGNYFDPDGDHQGAGDNDNITFSSQSALGEVKRWSHNVIVVDAPDVGGGVSPVQVTVHYEEPIGDLQSNTVDFNYMGGDIGPCLIELNPDQGLRNQGYQLIGEEFNPASTVKEIHFGGITACQNPPGSSCWNSDTVANSAVPGNAPYSPPDSDVWVVNDAGASNQLPFTVNAVPPGTFRVVDYEPKCTSSCPNATVWGQFSKALDQTTVTDNTVELYRCVDEDCAVGTLSEVATNLQYTPGEFRVYFAQIGGLAVPDVWYRGVIHGGAGGVMSVGPDSLELGDLNFDSDGVGGPDSHSWVFKTAPDTGECELASVQCQPATVSIPLSGTRMLQSRAFSEPNACNPAGQELDPWSFSWNWQSFDPGRVTVNPPAPDPVTTATGVQATLPGTPVDVETATSGFSAICQATVTTNTCVVDDDCINNPIPGACVGSRCEDGVCAPTVTNINPAVGAVGDWVTVAGCYFDSYVDGQSQVLFLQDGSSPDLVGLWPNPGVCGAPGSTWRDRQIITEVPNKRDGDINDPTDDVLVTGPLRVIRGTDLESVDSTLSFDPTGPIHPGICRVTPASGHAGIAQLRIQGQNFGVPPPAGTDGVVFYDGTAVGSRVLGSDFDWVSDEEVNDVLVPQSAINNDLAVPDPDPWNNDLELYLENDGTMSNLVDFNVIPPSCTVCTADPQCGGGATQGCGSSGPFHCCANRPVVDAFGPTNPPATCRNAQINASFVDAVTGDDIVMDRTTINPATVRLRNMATGVDVVIPPSNFHFPSPFSFSVSPGLLEPNTDYQVTIVGDEDIGQDPAIPEGVLSAGGVGMNGSRIWNFTTNDSICQLDRVVLVEDRYLFTGFGQTQAVQAFTYDQHGQPIDEVPGVYDWSWQWEPTADPVATVTNTDNPLQQITSVANGITTVRATAIHGDGWDGEKTGSAFVQVFACENPWPASGTPYRDPESPTTNFETWYCRDGNPLLPEVNAVAGAHVPSQSGVDELLREFFFENPDVNPKTNKHDAVGMLVWENEDQLSPTAWYEKKFNTEAPGATSKVDGYEAMRVGTTTYIAGTNLSSGVLYTNIYVLGYNDDAGEDIGDIFHQMLARLKLNINGSDFMYPGVPDYLAALEQVRRDTDRIGDLKDYNKALLAYSDEQGKFPELLTGTYIVSMSTSRWPSWTERLTEELRSVVPEDAVTHFDPKNDLVPACTDPFDPETCWDELGKRFFCPADSHIYAYQAGIGGTEFDMFAHVEYLGTGTWQTGDINPCSAPSSCPCFNYQLTGTATGGGGAPDLIPPTPPGNLTATANGPDRIDLTWELSSDAGGSGVQSYELYRSLDGTTWGSPFAVIAHPNANFSNSGLAPNTTYFYRAKARDFAGNLSGPSNTAQATTAPGGDIVPPGNVAITNGLQGDTEVTIEWTNPGDPDHVRTEIYRRDGPGTFLRSDPTATKILPDAEPSETSRTITGLTNGQTYTFGFFTYDEVPNFASGAFIQLTPNVSGSIQQITNFVAAPGDGQVQLNWVNSPAPYTGVMIRRSTSGYPSNPTDGTLVIDKAGVPSVPDFHLDAGLTNGTLYYYAAFAHDAVPNYALPGAPAEATPSGGGGIQQITGFTAIPGDGQIFLTWTNSPAPYAGVVIRRSTSGFPSDPTDGTFVIDKAGAPSVPDFHLDAGLTNGTLYYYSAFAHDNVPNYAIPGAQVSATPDDDPPLITGVDVPMRNITRTSIQIRWQTNELATSVVEIGTDPNQYEFGTFSDGSYLTDHSMTILGLQENTLYHFRVSSSDQAGNTTVDIDHVAVTDFRDDDGQWSGYFETPLSATWNGSANATICQNDCNQYYTCNADRTPNCVDAQNAGISATDTCGAIAYADCLDGTNDLPHGLHALTDAVFDAWVNNPTTSHLPRLAEIQDACENPPTGYGMPFTNPIWAGRKDTNSTRADIWMNFGACNYGDARLIDDPEQFMIVESNP